jgi:hypothetical protein
MKNNNAAAKLKKPIYFKLFLGLKLPTCFFWGIKLKELSEESCSVLIPFNGRTKNPFKSIYFAALAGAAELSTGLIWVNLLGFQAPYSILVKGCQLSFVKKSTTAITFTCADGLEAQKLVQQLQNSGDIVELNMNAIGKNEEGVTVAEMVFHWTIKRK